MMPYTTELPKKFWRNAEKAVGVCLDIDLSVKKICPIDIKESVRHAFRDLTVRTMDKKEEYKDQTLSLDVMAQTCCEKPDGFYPWLETWVEEAPSLDFDSWHYTACNKVKAFLEEYYVATDCTWGKAQKIVNMTLKNLYALCVVKGIEDIYAAHFKPCHVPLDSFTLEWFCRECVKHHHPLTKGKILNWSAIDTYGDKKTDEYTDGKKSYYTYFYFQKLFRVWYPDDTLSPLQAEFVYWPQIQLELAAENFLFALEEDITKQDKKEIREKPLEEKLEKIRNRLNA